MSTPFTILIPVFNETEALEFSAFYFRGLKVPVKYVLDSQRTPEAERTLRRITDEISIFDNDRPFIENGYESFAATSPTDWILRLDCDEVPSIEVIDACRAHIEHHPDATAGFERHQLVWRHDRFLSAATPRFRPTNSRQWRLFNRKNAIYDRGIHGPGLRLQNPVPIHPPATLYHLSWIFLTWEERLKKAARYESHGQSPENRKNQLFPLEDIAWQDLDQQVLRKAYADWVAIRATADLVI